MCSPALQSIYIFLLFLAALLCRLLVSDFPSNLLQNLFFILIKAWENKPDEMLRGIHLELRWHKSTFLTFILIQILLEVWSEVGDTWDESNQLNHVIIHYPNTEGKTSVAEKKVLLRWKLPFISDFLHLSLYKSLFPPCWCLICLPAENIEMWSNDTCRTWIDYYMWPRDLGLIQVEPVCVQRTLLRGSWLGRLTPSLAKSFFSSSLRISSCWDCWEEGFV